MTQPEILYEDAQLIVCYKPAGIATQTKKLGQKDMVSILLNHVAQEGTGQPFIGVVHRLDQPVEGVMVFAKTKQAAAKLSAQVKAHSFGKKYYAKVRLPEGKTFEQATGHEKTGTLQDWIQFEPKENKSCVIEQKQRENEREDIRHPADGKRLQLQKPRHTATSSGDQAGRRICIAGYYFTYRPPSSDPCTACTSWNSDLRRSQIWKG